MFGDGNLDQHMKKGAKNYSVGGRINAKGVGEKINSGDGTKVV